MLPPLVSYVTFNQLGLTKNSMESILKTVDDFEMHIVDNNSTDDTWEYIQSLKDSRIISKTKLEVNYGKVYAINLNLSARRPDQYFININNNVIIETLDFIKHFMNIFEEYPDAGLLGANENNYFYNREVIKKEKNGISFLELRANQSNFKDNFIPSFCLILRPELIQMIGYLSEENCYGDVELSYRVNNYTPFKTGFSQDISIKTLGKNTQDFLNNKFKTKFKWKFDETIKDMKSGARPVYCASYLDTDSTSNHIYNQEWAIENLNFFIENSK